MSPLFDLGDQIHGDIDRAGGAFLFECEMPARPSTARAVELAEVAFQKRAELTDLGQGGSAAAGIAVLRKLSCLHVNKV